jgi:glycosyltransferase involved in cell wall biosynthesis
MNPFVFHVVISLAPGGLERLVVDWTNARNRHHPGSTRIVCLDEPGALAGQVEGGKVSCVSARRSRFPWDYGAVRKVVKLLSCRPVVLHAHNLTAWQYAVLTKLWSKVYGLRSKVFFPRLIYTQHGANVHNMRLRDRVRALLLGCFTDEIVAVSEATADVMAKTMWVSRKRISVVVNGVAERKNPASFVPQGGTTEAMEVREKMGIPADAFVMGSVGRLAHVKGCDRLIAAFAELSRSQAAVLVEDKSIEQKSQRAQSEEKCISAGGGKENSSFASFATSVQISSTAWSEYFLLFVGDGSERAALEQQARDLGVSDRVIFAGYQADPAPYLAAMDLFVLPSRSEGLSVALLEAMAAGVPVVVTDVGANREVVDGGKCGVILPDDERKWPDMIAAIMNNPETIADKIQVARQRVRTYYSLEATLDGYERLYE